jgi:hypothetical protein
MFYGRERKMLLNFNGGTGTERGNLIALVVYSRIILKLISNLL